MDNTLDILNEILGTLGQVKNLMDEQLAAGGGKASPTLQERVVAQSITGDSSDIGVLLSTLDTYIKDFDQNKADIALLAFDYFIDSMNKISTFNESNINNLKGATEAFNTIAEIMQTIGISDSINFNDFVDSHDIIQKYVNMFAKIDWAELVASLDNVPAGIGDKSQALTNMMMSITSVSSAMDRIRMITPLDILKFKLISSKMYFGMINTFIKGTFETVKSIGDMPIVDINKFAIFNNMSDALFDIVTKSKKISILSVINFNIFSGLIFKALRKYITGMEKALNMVGDYDSAYEGKIESLNKLTIGFNGIVSSIMSLSIAVAAVVGTLTLTGMALIKWWPTISGGFLFAMGIVGLSFALLTQLNKIDNDNLANKIDILQDLNLFYVGLGATALVLSIELALVGAFTAAYWDNILFGIAATTVLFTTTTLFVKSIERLLGEETLKDSKTAVSRLYDLQLVSISLGATSMALAFIYNMVGGYTASRLGNIIYGMGVSHLILGSTLLFTVLLGKVFGDNKSQVMEALTALGVMGLIILEYGYITERLLDLGLMMEGHYGELMKASLFIGGTMLGMIGIITAVSLITKAAGGGAVAVGLLAIAASAGIIHYMTYVTEEIINLADRMKDVSILDLGLTVGLIYGSLVGMVGVVAAVGAFALGGGWTVLLAGGIALGAMSMLIHSAITMVERIVKLGQEFGGIKELLEQTSELFSDTMGILNDMWKSLLSFGAPDENDNSLDGFIKRIPILGSMYSSATTLISGAGMMVMLGVLSSATLLIDKVLSIGKEYSDVDPQLMRATLTNMLGIVNQFIPDMLRTLDNASGDELDKWKSKWWNPGTWGQGSRMGVILDAVKMTSSIMKMISNAGNMKIIKGFDENGEPIYEPMMESDLQNAAFKISQAMSIFVNTLFTELSKVDMGDSENLEKIKKVFDGGMFSSGLIGMTNSFITSVQKLGEGWIEEDGQGNRVRRRIDINTIPATGVKLGQAVGNFVISLTNGMVTAAKYANEYKKPLKRFKDLMMGNKGLMNTTGFIFKLVDKFMTNGTLEDENGRVVHRSGISINDLPKYGELLGSSVANLLTNMTDALVKVGTDFDNTKLNRLQRFKEVMLGGTFGGGLFDLITKIVKTTESIKKGEDYISNNGNIIKGSGYSIEVLPYNSALIGRSLSEFMVNIKSGIEAMAADENLLRKAELANKILLGSGLFNSGGVLGILDNIYKRIAKSEFANNNSMISVINTTKDNMNVVLGLTSEIQEQLRDMGFFTRDNINDTALKNYQKYLVTLTRILSTGDIAKFAFAVKKIEADSEASITKLGQKETPRIVNALEKMNKEIIDKQSARKRALDELTESLQKIGDQFERIGKTTNISNKVGAGGSSVSDKEVVTLQQDGQEISLSKETLSILLAAMADLKSDASAMLSSRNIIVELNGGGELAGRLMYVDPE